MMWFPKVRNEITIEKTFLILPLTLPGPSGKKESRWLETAYIKIRYYDKYNELLKFVTKDDYELYLKNKFTNV